MSVLEYAPVRSGSLAAMSCSKEIVTASLDAGPLQADFENFRKRMARENAAAVDRGVAKLAKELLPALDHLEHALKAAQGHEDVI